jgi:hypothetical protein
MRRNASQSRPLVRTVRTVRYCLMPGAEPPFAHLSVGECRYVRWWKLLELSIAAMLGLVPGSVSGRYVHLEKAAQSAVERVATRFRRLLDQRAALRQRLLNRRAPLLVGGFSGAALVSIRRSAVGL